MISTPNPTPSSAPPEILAIPAHTARLGDRSLFPTLAARVYLNHAAISPPSQTVIEALHGALAVFAAHGVAAVMGGFAQRRRLKDRVAGVLGGQPEDWALMPNTTGGLNAIALSLPWKRGDRVLLLHGDFPTNVTPWLSAARLHGLEPRWLDAAHFDAPGGPDLAPLEAELRRGIRLVVLSAVRFQTGTRLPVAAIGALCRAHGAELCVDAIQAAGAVPFGLEAADYVACGGHKWLMGPEGTALLYVRPEKRAALDPRPAGWLSHQDAAVFLFEPDAMRYDRPLREDAAVFEGGAPNVLGLLGLEASLSLIEQLGVPAIEAHIQRCIDPLDAGLRARGFLSRRAPDAARRSGVLAVQPQVEAHGPNVTVARLAAELNRRGIAVTTPDGHLRFAPHWPNQPAEAEVVLGALDEAVAQLQG